MRAKPKRLTKRNRGRSLVEVIGEVNRFAAGWLEYFRMLAMSRKGWYRKSASPQAKTSMNPAWFRHQGPNPLAWPTA